MTLAFSNFRIQLDSDGVVVSEVSDELAIQLRANPLFRYSPPKSVEIAPAPEEEKPDSTDEVECAKVEKPKSRKRSRRKATETTKNQD
jgi:hypothetical protein